jgi:hypothetical protein
MVAKECDVMWWSVMVRLAEGRGVHHSVLEYPSASKRGPWFGS